SNPALANGCAHGKQHGICSSYVIASSLGKEENRQRDQVHPSQHPVAAAAQEGNQAGYPQRGGKNIDADTKLGGKEALGAAFAYVAHVDVVEELVGDKIVAHQPEEVGQENQKRQCDPGPEPAAQDKSARTGERNTGQEPGDVKHDGVLGLEPQADYSTDGQPPARVLCLEQAD